MTIRTYLESIRDRYQPDWGSDNEGCWADHKDAVAALELLDKAEYATMVGSEYGDYCCDCGTPIRVWHPSWEKHGWSLSDDDIVGRFIPDPIQP